MKQTVIENETCLTIEYLDRKDVWTCDTDIIGRHSLVGCLDSAVRSRGAECRVYADLDRKLQHDGGQLLGNQLWYVLDLSDPDLDELRRTVEKCNDARRFLLCIILLENIESNDAIQRYAEMELISASEELGKVRNILSGCRDVRAIVLDRLIGAEFDSIGLSDIVKEAESGTITVTQDMANRYFSALYLPDAINAILTVSENGKVGNIYNATSFYMSEYALRSKLYTMFARRGVKLKVVDSDGEPSYAALSAGKLSSLGFEPVCGFDDALRYTVQAYTDKFDVQSDFITDSYSGKLSTLRRIQLDMLREIDRICRRHGIRYFLSGGSMLGAVRHGGYIPWDDDIDVAMLREEYNRFKAVAPAELNEKYSYQSFTNKDGYHYFFDRITAKDTYFASRYSDSYAMPKGISVDIFVYDNALDRRKAQRRFWNHLMHKRLFMNVRWKDEPRGEGKSRLISKLLLPLLRRRSMDSYSASYDKATRRYENRTTSTVMAPATDHKWHECMPKEWFTEVVPRRFEDVDTFLPVGYDGFLRNWYGEDYMTMLPLCQQTPYHDYYRLDVGSHIDSRSALHFDFKGELL